ncbi:mannose-6-phosphate isomerase-like protein (cupin superfamily) [Bradyrhizobium sp. LB1.3]
MDQQKLDRAIGRRLKTLRTQAGMDAELCAALDVSLSDVVALAEKPPERLVRLADQPHWRDPESGCRRRHASPTDAARGIEIIVVDLPAGARVPYSPWGRTAFTQQLLMLEGAIAVHIDAKAVRLREGDCLDFDVMRAAMFENETRQDARYVIITRRGRFLWKNVMVLMQYEIVE